MTPYRQWKIDPWGRNPYVAHVQHGGVWAVGIGPTPYSALRKAARRCRNTIVFIMRNKLSQ